jgi:DNA-binding MarR family transcriptional regulator
MKTIGSTRADVADSNAGDVSANSNAFLLEAFLPHELAVTSAQISRLFARRYAAAFGLSVAEWSVMAVVGRYGTIVPGAVVARTNMDKMKVSRASASLVAADLLEHGPAPHDGRAHLLRLTRKGRMVHDGSMSFALALEAQLAAGLSGREWTTLRHCLRRLQERVHTLERAQTPATGKQTRVRGPGW